MLLVFFVRAVLEYHGCQIPKDAASFIIGNEIIDLIAHVDLEILARAEQKAIDLGHGEVKRFTLAVHATLIGQALTVEGANALSRVAQQRLAVQRGQAEFDVRGQRVIGRLADLLLEQLLLPTVPLRQIGKGNAAGEVVAVVQRSQLAAGRAEDVAVVGGQRAIFHAPGCFPGRVPAFWCGNGPRDAS